MDVISRLKSAVTNVLPVGNPITGEFEILGQRASGGPALLWKVYDGVQRSTKQEASVFVFEKKQLDRFSRRDRDVVLDVLKKGVSQLTRLRHPKILSILHPLEDSRESLAFATEPVLCSLANVLNQHENLPQQALTALKDYSFFDVEIKYGILQIVEGLGFLHNSVHLVHTNICPESIFVNSIGCWKIAGFDFCINNTNTQSQQPYYPLREWDPQLTPVAQPKLNYLAPEYALTSACDPASDMFAVGVLIHALHNGGRPIFDSVSDWSIFRKNTDQLKTLKVSLLSNIPDEVRDHLKLLLNVEPALRPDADQLSKIPYFEDVGVITLQYLDMLVQKDNLQKSQFFKGLPKVIEKLPLRVNLQRVFPSLCKECSNNNMVPFVLPNMMLIAEKASDADFSKHIFPAFIPLFRITEPVQVMLIFLQNMSLLLSKTPPSDIRNHVLPMIARALEANQQQIQELCLGIIPTFAGLVEYTSLKNTIIPRITKLCLSAALLSVRVNCLVCLGKILEHLDRWYVMDEVLPMLQQIPSREPAVLMSILGIYKVALTHKKLGITKELLATKVVPFLFPLCIDNGLNLGQFNAFITIVKDMMSQVESEHRTKLEQLNSLQQENRVLQQFAQETVQGGSVPAPSSALKTTPDGSLMESFISDLGLAAFSSSSASSSAMQSNKHISSSSGGTAPNTTSSPAKTTTSLTMEEKARLSREQEMHQRYKSQPPLQSATMTTSSGGSAVTKSSVRDLSSTLMNTSVHPPSVALGSGSTVLPGAVSSASGVCWGTTHSAGSAMSQSWNGQPQPAKSSAPPRTVDMSALDNIMPMSSKTRPSLNSMVQPPPASGPNPFSTSTSMMPPQRNSVPTAFGQTSMMMPGVSSQMGIPASFGGVHPMTAGNSAMMGGIPLAAPQQPGIPQSSQQASTNNPTSLSNKDIADLLG